MKKSQSMEGVEVEDTLIQTFAAVGIDIDAPVDWLKIRDEFVAANGVYLIDSWDFCARWLIDRSREKLAVYIREWLSSGEGPQFAWVTINNPTALAPVFELPKRLRRSVETNRAVSTAFLNWVAERESQNHE